MATRALDLPRYEESTSIQPVRIIPDSQQDSDESHEQEPMTKTESQLFEIREIVHNVAGTVAVSTKLMERLLENQANQANAQAQPNSTGREVGRSVDTLRRDIGMLAILLGMMIQTGAAFYWAGGISKQIDAQKERFQEIQAEQAYQRAQNQLMDGQMKAEKARQEERDKQQQQQRGG